MYFLSSRKNPSSTGVEGSRAGAQLQATLQGKGREHIAGQGIHSAALLHVGWGGGGLLLHGVCPLVGSAVFSVRTPHQSAALSPTNLPPLPWSRHLSQTVQTGGLAQLFQLLVNYLASCLWPAPPGLRCTDNGIMPSFC